MYLSRKGSIELKAPDVNRWHEKIVQNYHSYFAGAPSYWDKDFFLSSEPISIVYRYGQNIPISSQEASLWAGERDYKKIQFVSIALATQLT